MINGYRVGRVTLTTFLILYLLFNKVGFLSDILWEAPNTIIRSKVSIEKKNENFETMYQNLKDDMRSEGFSYIVENFYIEYGKDKNIKEFQVSFLIGRKESIFRRVYHYELKGNKGKMIYRNYKFTELHRNIINNSISVYDFITPLNEFKKTKEFKEADSVKIYGNRKEFKGIVMKEEKEVIKRLDYEEFKLWES